MEKRGVTAIIVATETFKPLIMAQAKARRVTPKMVVVKHPVGGLNASELAERIDTAVQSLADFR